MPRRGLAPPSTSIFTTAGLTVLATSDTVREYASSNPSSGVHLGCHRGWRSSRS